jgi:hypothetical protein
MTSATPEGAQRTRPGDGRQAQPHHQKEHDGEQGTVMPRSTRATAPLPQRWCVNVPTTVRDHG